MREIVIDTETTGLDPLEGHRVVEIRAVELVNHCPTANRGAFREPVALSVMRVDASDTWGLLGGRAAFRRPDEALAPSATALGLCG